MTPYVAKKLTPENADLAKDLDIRGEVWVVWHGEAIVCVTSKDSATGLQAFLNTKEDMRKFFEGVDLRYDAFVRNEKLKRDYRVAKCVSLECKKYIEEHFGSKNKAPEGTPPTAGPKGKFD